MIFVYTFSPLYATIDTIWISTTPGKADLVIFEKKSCPRWHAPAALARPFSDKLLGLWQHRILHCTQLDEQGKLNIIMWKMIMTKGTLMGFSWITLKKCVIAITTHLSGYTTIWYSECEIKLLINITIHFRSYFCLHLFADLFTWIFLHSPEWILITSCPCV